MSSIRKRGSNSYLIVVSRGYDYEGNRLKSVQKTVKPPKEYTPKQAEKWVKEQVILFEREVQHVAEVILKSQKRKTSLQKTHCNDVFGATGRIRTSGLPGRRTTTRHAIR